MYSRPTFLDFFKTEQLDDAGCATYTLSIDNQFKFSVFMSTYEEQASVTLYSNKYKKFIFNVDMNHIDNVSLYKNELSFFQTNSNVPILTVTLKPNITLRFKD